MILSTMDNMDRGGKKMLKKDEIIDLQGNHIRKQERLIEDQQDVIIRKEN